MTVELDPDSEPIHGTVSDENAARSFTGWMQLVTALQAAIDDTHPDRTETRKPNDLPRQ
jgi:hypothetical protein